MSLSERLLCDCVLFRGADRVVSNEEGINHPFVTAMVKGDTGQAPGHWAIKGADAQAGELKSYWDGKVRPNYKPPTPFTLTSVSVSAACGLSQEVFDLSAGCLCVCSAPRVTPR